MVAACTFSKPLRAFLWASFPEYRIVASQIGIGICELNPICHTSGTDKLACPTSLIIPSFYLSILYF